MAAQVLDVVGENATVGVSQHPPRFRTQHHWPTRTRDIHPTVGQAPIVPAGWYIVSRREPIVWAVASEQRRRCTRPATRWPPPRVRRRGNSTAISQGCGSVAASLRSTARTRSTPKAGRR